MNPIKYSVLIQWSEEDQCYIATLPEWGQHTHGKSYAEAAQAAEEVLENLLTIWREPGQVLPAPDLFVFPEEKEGEEEQMQAHV
jgi:antitoxin HicB